MVLATVLTERSMTQTLAPMLTTVAEARAMIPENMEVIWTIKKTAKMIPTRSAMNLARSFTRSL